MNVRLLPTALAGFAVLSLPVAAGLTQPSHPPGGRPDGPQRRDWTLTAVRTPQGGFRMGNPNAPIQLVEYLSLSCSHCAEFANASGSLFSQYVRSGQVSVEYRNFVLNAYDLAATFLVRCAAPREYFSMSHELLSTQNSWMTRVRALTDAQRGELRQMPPLQVMQRLVVLLGFDALAARHGITPASQRTCLAAQAGLDQIGTMHQEAERLGVIGTPTFFINGEMTTLATWAAIEPRLRVR